MLPESHGELDAGDLVAVAEEEAGGEDASHPGAAQQPGQDEQDGQEKALDGWNGN